MNKYLLVVFACVMSLQSYSKSEQDSILSLLNKELSNKYIYMEKKEQKINSLKELLAVNELPYAQEYDINVKLYSIEIR